MNMLQCARVAPLIVRGLSIHILHIKCYELTKGYSICFSCTLDLHNIIISACAHYSKTTINPQTASIPANRNCKLIMV